MTNLSHLYEFSFRGLLAEESLDRAGRRARHLAGIQDEELAKALALGLLDEQFVETGRRMSLVYTAIAAFESSARQLVTSVLLEAAGENWWEERIAENIRRSAQSRLDDELKYRYHAQRGGDPITYTDLGQLSKIIQANWELFQAHVPSQEWVKALFEAVERSRNVIMHSGLLDLEDLQRLGINIRDWVKQVGA